MTVRQLHTVDGYYGVTGDGFNPKGALSIDGSELDEESMSTLQSNRVPIACGLSLLVPQFTNQQA